MTTRKQNPGACAGAEKTERLDGGSKPKHNISSSEIETYAADFVARRYRLAPSFARLICRLARIGEVLT